MDSLSIEAYWARIARIPIYIDRETADGDAVLGRTRSGDPARIEKPDRHDEESRLRLLEFYEQMYGAGSR